MQRLKASFSGAAFARHRHATYAIGVTDSGVQAFWYRGAVHASLPGNVVVLHPDEVHDGYAGTREGFSYRIVYVEPARVSDACREIAGHACALPFVREPVVKSRRLRQLVDASFAADLEPLTADALIAELADALLEETGGPRAGPLRLHAPAVRRARELLDSATHRIVRSKELEHASGLSRFELARQFRACMGTSPYRYSVYRRLEAARRRLGEASTAELAIEAAFADQAHFARAFKRTFGVTPGRHARLRFD